MTSMTQVQQRTRDFTVTHEDIHQQLGHIRGTLDAQEKRQDATDSRITKIDCKLDRLIEFSSDQNATRRFGWRVLGIAGSVAAFLLSALAWGMVEYFNHQTAQRELLLREQAIETHDALPDSEPDDQVDDLAETLMDRLEDRANETGQGD